MKKLTTLSILFITLAFIAPIQVSAATSAGIKPGNFFYFFDTASEKINLFFTFNPEKKAQQALEYADERLAEAGESANENNPKAVEKAMIGYKEEISLATEESKGLKDEGRAKELLNTVSENTAKHQEVLVGVLEKVPEEARQAILNAIDISKNSQAEVTKQIMELKSEIERLKKEVVELKKEPNDAQANEVEKLKKEVEELKKNQGTIQSTPKQSIVIPETNKVTKTVTSPVPQVMEKKASIVTFPSGAIAEIDEKGNVVRWVKEAPSSVEVALGQSTQNQFSEEIKIGSINTIPAITSVKIEWQTDKPTESKIFLSGGELSSKVYNSESGLSTRHSVLVNGLKGGTFYSLEIEAIAGGKSYKKTASFSTQSAPPPTFSISKEPVPGPSWPGWNTFKISSANGTFVIEAITLEIVDPETVVSPTTREGFVNRNGDYRRCDAINDAFMQWQSITYPHPCPLSSINPVYLAKSNPTWKNESINISISSDTISPPGTDIYYYKVKDKVTGKVFEYQK